MTFQISNKRNDAGGFGVTLEVVVVYAELEAKHNEGVNGEFLLENREQFFAGKGHCFVFWLAIKKPLTV